MTIPKKPNYTPVVFRKFKDGEVIALFPHEPYNNWDIYEIGSYMHVGQHSGASIDLVNNTKPCKLHSPKPIYRLPFLIHLSIY